LELFDGCSYDKIYTIADGLKLRFQDVGHLLGSACMEIWITEGDTTKKLVFSGDLGNVDKPVIRDPTYNVKEADYVIMESTYGDREHAPEPDYVHFLADVINRTLARGGTVVIPSFAVGRTQELLYFIRELKEQHLEQQDFDVYVDSPLAIEATNIFQENMYGYFDDEAMALVRKGINPLMFPGLKFATTSEESKQINFDPTPKVIISASGMCEAGRIRHHLKHNLWRPECTILFAGYQAVDTTGRAILDGKKEITLFGEPISVKAEIVQIPDSSGHADKDGLIKWLLSIDQKKPQHVFIVHGEDAVCDSFAALLHDKYGYNTTAPYTGMSYDLKSDVMLREGSRERKSRRTTAKQRRAEGVFARLVAAGERLMEVIRHNEGGANKDIAKFTNQINMLCDKWDR
ncbi:MAG: MBL fold metallo-hydrolase, partial [Lachnospiraceae bacterium]|nr:MBL fold metallo-hydrolase [Lachnospiraceae bacterium]